MAVLEAEIARYESVRDELEKEHRGEWVLIHKDMLAGTFPSFEAAGTAAVKRFGRGPYLIRKIGAPPVSLPASVLYRLSHGRD